MMKGALLTNVQKQFDRCATSYDDVAECQVQVADLMLSRLEPLALSPQRILDMGSGTGYCAHHLAQQYPKADVFAMDVSLQMLARQADRDEKVTGLCADCHQMPFVAGSFDLIVSNMVLHWCQDIAKVLQEIKALLSPNGVFVFTLAGPETFHEWQQAWQSIDQYAHVLPFVPPSQLVQWLVASGFKDVVVDAERWVMAYQSFSDVHHAMKHAGACMPVSARQGMLGRSAYQRLCEAYQAFCDEAGHFPLSYDISMVYAKSPDPAKAAAGTTSYVSVDQIIRA